MTPFDSLADESRWVGWRNELRGGKPTKVPKGRNCRNAKSDDPSTWGTRAEAEAWAAQLVNGQGGGVGIQLGELGGDTYLVGIDLDSCISDDGNLAGWTQHILGALPTYTEVSPSGRGLKIFFYCATEDVRPFLNLVGVSDSNQWGFNRSIPGQRSKADHGPGVELYCSGRFFTVTGKQWPSQPDKVASLDWPMLERLAELVPPAGSKNAGSGKGDSRGSDNSRSAAAFRKGAAMRRAGNTFEQMAESLRADPETADWVREKGEANGERELRRIWDRAAGSDGVDKEAEPGMHGVTLADFHAYMPMHSYIYAPSRETWPGVSVNARIPPIPMVDAHGNPVLNERGEPKKITASLWLDQNKSVEQMTWAPGLPMLIRDRLISEGGWIERGGVTCFNLYRPPIIKPGDARQAQRWGDHVRKVFPDDHEHIINWLAHRVQQPQDKINHALVLGGPQGIGKDTLLEPVKRAIGPWNFREASPPQIVGRFNGFLKAVILRISEAHDTGAETDRFKLYEHMKVYTAAPPDVLRCDEKNLREYSIPNVCGVIITTNHKADGIFLPPDDRRHYVAWSDLTKDDFSDAYWDSLWEWYDRGGSNHVAAYLAGIDLSGFNPKAPPPKTQAFWEIVDASRAPEDAELADVIDILGNPDIFTISQVAIRATESFANWLRDRKNSRYIPHRVEECGYVAVRNNGAKSGLWVFQNKRQVIYAKASLSPRERIAAAQKACATR